MTGFTACVFLFPNRVSLKEAFEVLEPDDGKLSRPVLRGPGPSNGVRLLGHVVHEPSHPPRGSSAGAHTLRRRVVCSLRCSWPWLRLNARFYQAEPAPVVGTTKCPESLCLMLVLPSSESRVPTLPRTLLPVPRSYGLIRQSHVALLFFCYWPRLRSLSRLLPAPAATGIFRVEETR